MPEFCSAEITWSTLTCINNCRHSFRFMLVGNNNNKIILFQMNPNLIVFHFSSNLRPDKDISNMKYLSQLYEELEKKKRKQ